MLRCDAGNTHCQCHLQAVMGYLRSKTFTNVTILKPEGKTTNIVISHSSPYSRKKENTA